MWGLGFREWSIQRSGFRVQSVGRKDVCGTHQYAVALALCSSLAVIARRIVPMPWPPAQRLCRALRPPPTTVSLPRVANSHSLANSDGLSNAPQLHAAGAAEAAELPAAAAVAVAATSGMGGDGSMESKAGRRSYEWPQTRNAVSAYKSAHAHVRMDVQAHMQRTASLQVHHRTSRT